MRNQYVRDLTIKSCFCFIFHIFFSEICKVINKYIMVNIFLCKDYAFRRFLPCPDPFLECQRFVNFAVLFINARSSLILSCSSGSPLFIYYATYRVVEGEKRIMSGGGGEKSVSPY